jgi:putative endonuclease
MPKCFYVYILASGPCGYLYVGVTNDLIRRVAEHKQGLIPGYTAERGIDRLVWYETHHYIDQAILREKRIKRWLRKWKFALVEEGNPHCTGSICTESCAREGLRPGSAKPTRPEV